MADNSGGNSFLIRVLIVLYAAGLILVAWAPLSKQYGPQIRRAKSAVQRYFDFGEPRLKSTSSSSGARSSVPLTVKAEADEKGVAAEATPAAEPGKSRDKITREDKKKLQRVLDKL